MKGVVTDTSIPEVSIESAVGQIVEWLKWPSARNVDLWLLCFLTELAAHKKLSLLIRITELNAEQVKEKDDVDVKKKTVEGVDRKRHCQQTSHDISVPQKAVWEALGVAQRIELILCSMMLRCFVTIFLSF